MSSFKDKVVYQIYPKSFRDADGDGIGDLRGIIEKLHLFDKTQADLNWRNPEVREELKKVIGFWKEKGVKGFRFDVVNLISKPEEFKDDHQGDGRRFYTDGSHVHEYLKELVRDTGIGDMVTVGEMSSTTLENGIRYTDPEEKELSMCFSFHHLKADYKNGEKWEIQPTDYEKLTDILKTWQLGMENNRGWNAVFWCNHDQPRIVSRLGDETTYWKESTKMLAAMVHMMRGTPYIYQGEELGMTNAHFTDISQYRDVESINYYGIMTGHGKTKEEALHILNERSRDNGRTPMQWNGEKNAGFSQGQPWISLPAHRENINVEAEIRDETSVLWYYRKLIEILKKEKAVSLGKIEFLDEKDALIFAYRRVWEEDEIVVYSNLSGEKKKLWDEREEDKRKAEDYEKLLGNYEDMDAFAEGYLRPYESLILKRK